MRRPGREVDRVTPGVGGLEAEERVEVGREDGEETVRQSRRTAPREREAVGHHARERAGIRDGVRHAELVAIQRKSAEPRYEEVLPQINFM